MKTSQTLTHDWRGILGAFEAKTKEIQTRNQTVGGQSDSEPHSEAVRWAMYVRRIVDEIAFFIKGEWATN